MVERRERFVSTRQFLETARSYDITEEECILEALDNSIDAGAHNIRIHIKKMIEMNRYGCIMESEYQPSTWMMTVWSIREYPTFWHTGAEYLITASR